jgi:hypothetical protein
VQEVAVAIAQVHHARHLPVPTQVAIVQMQVLVAIVQVQEVAVPTVVAVVAVVWD